MPTTQAIRRLFEYYRSEMFQDAFRRRNAEGGKRAADYRQHLVDQMNAHYQSEGIQPSSEDFERQTLFLEGAMGIVELATLASDYGVAGLPKLPD